MLTMGLTSFGGCNGSLRDFVGLILLLYVELLLLLLLLLLLQLNFARVQSSIVLLLQQQAALVTLLSLQIGLEMNERECRVSD